MMNLYHCIGETLATVLIWESAAILVLYAMISATVFVPAALRATSQRQHILWASLALVFPSCGLCGYGTTILAAWHPEWAYPLKACLMAAGIISCVVFLVAVRGHSLTASEDLLDQLEVAQQEGKTTEDLMDMVSAALAHKRSL